MKPRLNEPQQHILELLGSGWQIGTGSGPADRVWIQKGGAGCGGETENVKSADLHALFVQRLVYVSRKGFPTSTVDITEAGRALLDGKWSDAIFKKVAAIISDNGLPLQTMPEDEGLPPAKHASYGQIGINHVSGCKGHLYGTSIEHSHRVQLTIRHSEISRHENHEHYHGVGEIVMVEMSPDQLVSLLFNTNRGDGVPCTIVSMGGKDIEAPIFSTRRSAISRRFSKTIEAITENATVLKAEAERILKTPGALKADDKKYLLDILNKLVQDARANIPFIETQFQAALEKSVMEAEAQLSQRAQSLSLPGGPAEAKGLLEPGK